MAPASVGGISWSTGGAPAATMCGMRTPDEDGSPDDGTVSSSLGDGFGSSASDLTDGFGEDDFSEDNSFDPTDTTSTDDGGLDDTTDGDGSDTPFGDGLSDAEAENVLVEILEDVFGDDAPEVLDDMEAATGLDAGELIDALDETDSTPDDDGIDAFSLDGPGAGDLVPDDGFDPFEPSEIPSESDFDLTGDGHVDHHDLHEAAHPFDFDISD